MKRLDTSSLQFNKFRIVGMENLEKFGAQKEES